jgi:hypothetical protein
MELKMLNRPKFSLRGARAATISTIRRASGSAIADLCLVLWGPGIDNSRALCDCYPTKEVEDATVTYPSDRGR